MKSFADSMRRGIRDLAGPGLAGLDLARLLLSFSANQHRGTRRHLSTNTMMRFGDVVFPSKSRGIGSFVLQLLEQICTELGYARRLGEVGSGLSDEP